MSPIRDSPGVQWLRLHASTAGGLDSISGWRTKIPHASGHSQKKVSPINSEAAAAAAKSLQSCPTLSDTMDCSLPGSPAHGIFQARVLEWFAIAFSVIVKHLSRNLPTVVAEVPSQGIWDSFLTCTQSALKK